MKKHWKKIVLIVLVIVALLFGSVALLYTGKMTSAKEKVFNALPLPAAIVGTKIVTVKDVLTKVPSAKKFDDPKNPIPTATIENSLLDSLIQQQQILVLAGKKNLVATSGEISEIYDSFVQQATSGDKDKFNKTLQDDYGMTPESFKSDILTLRLLQNKLSIWYNSQESLNSTSYSKLHEIETKAKAGDNFDQLVVTYSDDSGAKATFGDSGPLDYNTLTPEFQKAVEGGNKGDIRTVSSGVGIHLIKITEPIITKDNIKTAHFQDILIKTDGFDKWLQENLKAVTSKKLIKFS